MNKIMKFIIQPDNAIGISTIIVGIVFGILSIFTDINLKITMGVILLVFSSSILLFLLNSKTVYEMKGHCTYKQSISNIFHSYDSLENEMRTKIEAAEDIWLLTRTGQGWMYKERFKSELGRVFRNKGKLLVLDPDNGALKMVKMRIKKEWETRNASSHLDKKNVIHFLDWFKELYPNTEVGVIDYLPAYTLLIINPTHKDYRKSIIYVELSNFDAGSKNRLIFKVTMTDLFYFEKFINEFKSMWDKSRKWEAIGQKNARIQN